MMLQYSIYSVISPEGCASILWKSAEKAADAAATLGVTSSRLKELGLVDQIIQEPLGGAHRNQEEMAERIRDAIEVRLRELENMPIAKLVERRQERLLSYGEFEG
jgi:acetyl-CoA carboxylase carboxyl transferase subunit alpha